MLSPPPFSNPQLPTTSSGVSVVRNIISYDNNMMLVAIISLLLVILFVLLLHLYAKWFLVQAARRGGARGAVSVPQVLGARFHHHFHTFSADTTMVSCSPSKGLDASVIATIPQFVYKSEEGQRGLECVICLCAFEDEEVGRKLPKCDHTFHVECIDMWLHSHKTCPTCRGPAICDDKYVININEQGEHDQDELEEVALEELEIAVVEGTVEGNENVATDSLSVSEEANPIGGSLTRMMSRSKCVGKIHPSGDVIEHLPERADQAH